ncbi:MAG: DNA adenine methylase [Rhizobiaceae bacterium]|nr:DNA adenine methylase [Rhizobiaceae bacterium]
MVERSIYYLGNKAASAKEIAHHCEKYSRRGSYIIDLFAGSGAVAREISKYSQVMTNDIQTFSRKICEASLIVSENDKREAKTIILSEDVLRKAENCISRYSNYIDDEQRIVSDTARGVPSTEMLREEMTERLFADAKGHDPIVGTFGGVYFTVRDACVLQALYDATSVLPPNQRVVGEACLFAAASRCSITVGNQFAQPRKLSYRDGRAKIAAAKLYRASAVRNPLEIAFAACDMFPVRGRASDQNKCLQGLDTDVAKENIGAAKLVYLDPPYGREHYSRFYHVLEDIAVGQFAPVDNMKSRMRSGRFQSPYSIRSQAPRAFTEVLDICSAADVPVAVSYVDESRGSAVENRIVTIDFLRALISERYQRLIEIPMMRKNYSQMNKLSKPDGRIGTEVLLVGCG